jgi:hypothetical protein
VRSEPPVECAAGAEEEYLVLDQVLETGEPASEETETVEAESEDGSSAIPDSTYPGFSGRFSKTLENADGFYGMLPT